MIYVCPLSEVEANVARLAPSHLVSLLDPQTMIETPRAMIGRRHLKVGVNDIAQPQQGYIAPEEGHVRELVHFLGEWDEAAPLLIHCWAGISRSTASAFIALCQRNEGFEHEAAQLIRARAAHAQPNKRIVALADKLMGRNGRMVAAVAAMGPAEFVPEGFTFMLPHRLDLES
jgi:predicted protein tyrosine phosphatase